MATEWKKVRLDAICSSITDGDHLPPPKAESGIPFVTIANIKDNKFDFSNTMFVPQSYYDKLDSKRKATNGNILYSVVGSYGIPVLIKENTPFVFQRHIAILRPNSEEILPEYLYYTMLSKDFYAKADAVAVGAAQKTISLSSLRGIEVEIPSLKKQQKIAGVLSAYDDLIENNRRQIKLLEEAAQKLYKEWFVKQNFPGHENTKIVNGVPEGWKYKPLNSLVDFQNGYAFKSDSFDESGDYRLITIKNVKDGLFDYLNVNKIKVIPSGMQDWCKLEIGDSLVSLTGNVGRVCLVTTENCLLNQRVAKIACTFTSYAYILFRSKDMFNIMNKLAKGAAQQNLSPIQLGEEKILMSENQLIKRFDQLVEPFVKEIICLNRQNQDLQLARDKLLPKLMRQPHERRVK